LNGWFGPWHSATLCGLQQKLNFHSFEGENDMPVIRAIENSSIKQCSNIAMDGLNIAPDSPRSFAD